MAALLGALMLLYVPLHTAYQGLQAPPIHDVTTDPEDPPAFVALAGNGARNSRPWLPEMIDYRGEHNTVSYMLHEYYSGLTKPAGADHGEQDPAGKMFWRCFNAAKRMGWHIVDYNEKRAASKRPPPASGSARFRHRDPGAAGRHLGGAIRHAGGRARRASRDFGRNLALMKTYRADLNS